MLCAFASLLASSNFVHFGCRACNYRQRSYVCLPYVHMQKKAKLHIIISSKDEVYELAVLPTAESKNIV